MSDEKKASIPALGNEPRIVVPVTKKMETLLDELVETGLYGASRPDAARRLIERGLEDALTGGDVE